MSYLDRLDTHTDLMHRMADTVGAELGSALIDGRVSATELRSLYLSCARCDAPEACSEWLDAHAEGADGPPGFCRNSQSLARLARG